jgi:hypothetical protein
VAIPRGYKLRPVEAVQTWLAAAEISAGPVFRAVALGGCDPTIEVDIDRNALERLCYVFLLRTHSSESAAAELTHYRYLSTEYGDFQKDPDVEAYLKRMLAHRIKVELDGELETFPSQSAGALL